MPAVVLALAVLATQVVVYTLPPWLAVRRWVVAGPWPLTLLVALLLGLTSQSLCGILWSRCVPGAAGGEVAVYLGFWLLLALAATVRRSPPARRSAAVPLTLRENAGLVGILLLALAVRSLHPLHVWALGQSDAYTHLTMLRELLADGRLANSGYPPGYAWTLALPAALSRLDAYFVARFGGAFYGAALVLAVYALVRFGCGRPRAALFSAFFAACFPGLMLLLKTGVGTFANQLGLLLVPCVFLGLLLAHREPPARRLAWLLMATALLGLLLAVPMMALQTLLVLLSAQMVFIAWRSAADRRRVAHRLLWLVPALLALGVVPLLGAGRVWLARSVMVMTQAEETFVAPLPLAPGCSWTRVLEVGSALAQLVRDFLHIKRWGFHHPLFDVALLAMLAFFLGALVWGFRKRRPGWLLLGFWGALASVQTATGFLQFTAYQREGWSLLIAVACLGGLVADVFWHWSRWFRPVIAIGLACSAGWTLAHPPLHTLTNSTAEEELVHIARLLRSYPVLTPDAHAATEDLRRFLLTRLATNQPLAVITRPLMQECMLAAVAGSNTAVAFSRGEVYRTAQVELTNAPQTLLLLDQRPSGTGVNLELLAKVSPELSRDYWRRQNLSYYVNEGLVHCAGRLAPQACRMEAHAVTDRLRALVVRRTTSNLPPVTKAQPSTTHADAPELEGSSQGGNRPAGLQATAAGGLEEKGKTMSVNVGGGIKMEFVWIPPGEFVMGSPVGERGRSDDEGPQHRVTISHGFWMGKYEVTQEQWAQVMGGHPSYFEGAQRPVELVSWNDCQEFIQKLNAKFPMDGARKFSLPTEAEWEYACRAGTKERFYTGDSDMEPDRIGWNTAISEGKTHPVGGKLPNAWGLYDTCGNVGEWCQDWYAKDYYAGSPHSDPPGPLTGSERLVRGGSWFFSVQTCRSASRDGFVPDYRYSNLGCRLVVR
jgi:formylglycine-generating enzyme required for sulfatase activity